MVRETRHLWVGNLPDNIREDRIREHFKRYGRVQNVKLLGRTENPTAGANVGAGSGICATVAFMDIKSASKAHNAEHVVEERTLTTEYYEPAAIPTAAAAAGAPSAGSSPAGSGYSGSSSSVNSGPAPAPATGSRYHLSGGEEGSTANVCAMAASAAAPAAWRGTNDSATDFCRRGNTPSGYGRYQRNNSTTPYSTPPSNAERSSGGQARWYTGGTVGTESAPSTPGGAGCGTERRRRSGSGSTRSPSSSPPPSDTSRASTPAAPHHTPTRKPTPDNHHQWASTASGRPLAICVRNLPTRSTDSSLKDGLYHEYKKHGKVVWVKVVGQNADRYAVVRFKKPSDVEKALEVSQDKLFFGCKISVAPHQSCDEDADSVKPYETDIDEYHPKATRTLFIGNLEKDVTQQQLRDKFKHFGRIIEIDIKKGSSGGAGYAFCQFASISSVVEAIRAMDGEHVGGARVKLGFGKPVATTCVWVDGLTDHTEKQVLACVGRSGAAVSVSVCVDRAAGAALVHFEQAAAAGACVRDLRRLAALASATPHQPRLCVDYASRECQEAFYEQLEKHGGSERLAAATPPPRYSTPRHEPARSRASSYGRGSSRTPRYSTLEHYDPADYAADRRYRVYDEVGSSPPVEEQALPYEERLQSVVVSPHRARRHRHDSSPDDRKHSKERHRSSVSAVSARRSRSGSRGSRHARRRHRRRRSGSPRAGTPLRDEPAPHEPRRPPRDRPTLPMCLPLPKFAAQLLRTTPATPRPEPAAAPASPPRPPSATSSDASDAPHSPSLEERIRSLDEKYERWSGSRPQVEPPAPPRPRHRLLEVDIHEVKPSEVVRSLLAKRSVFDEDSERLEGVGRPEAPRALRYPFPAHPTDPRLHRAPQLPPDRLAKINEADYRRAHHHAAARDPSDDSTSRHDVTFDTPHEADPKLPCTDTSSQGDSQALAPTCKRPATPHTPPAPPEPPAPPISTNYCEKDLFKCEKTVSDDSSDSGSRAKPEAVILEELRQDIANESKLNDVRVVTKLDKSLEACIVEDIKKDLNNLERSQQNHLDSGEVSMKTVKNISDMTHELIKTNDKNGKERYSQNMILEALQSTKLEKENIQLEKPCDNEGFLSNTSFSSDKKPLNNKIIEDRGKLDRERVKKSKERYEQDFNFTTKTGKQECLGDKSDKEIKSESTSNSDKFLHEMSDKIKIEKDLNKQIKEEIHKRDRETEKAKHDEEKLRHSGEKIKHSDEKSKNCDEKNAQCEKPKHSEEKPKHSDETVKHSDDKFKYSEDKSKQLDDKTKHGEDKQKHIDVKQKHSVEKHKHSDDKPRHSDDKPRHYEEKSSRHDHHRRDKFDKDRRKDSIESEHRDHHSSSKNKKEDKHKYERPKNHESKRDIKKDSESSKSRKSSRDETIRPVLDLYRKDSTDSSASRTSHESAKIKESEHIDVKDEIKPKIKLYGDLFSKIDQVKETSTKLSCPKADIKVKEEKDLKNDTVKHKSNAASVENNIKCKAEIEKPRHYSVDSPSVDSKRKERLNSCSSLPPSIGIKRRMSSQDCFDLLKEETKRSKTDFKATERKDSKDARSGDRHKTPKFSKCHFAKLIESKTKDDKKNQVKTPDETSSGTKDVERSSDVRDQKCLDKQNPPKKVCDIESKLNKDLPNEILQNDLDFLATLELTSSEENERQKALRKEMKEKKRIQQLQQIQELQMQHDAMQQAELSKCKDDKKQRIDEKRKEAAREKRMSTDRKSKDDKVECNKRKERKKLNSTDSSESDEPKKHSIFDIIDDEPMYISMYDKVKARSCKNMQKQEEEKRQEKIKAKFSQLKQSRAKREEKKRSSWDEDSDSENDHRKPQKSSMDGSSDDEQIVLHSKKREKSHGSSLDYDKTNEYFGVHSNEEDSRNKLSRKNSRTRIMSDSSDEETFKRSNSRSPTFSNAIKKEIFSDSESSQFKYDDILLKEANNDRIKKNSLLALFGKSEVNDKSRPRFDDFKASFNKSFHQDISSESESMISGKHSGEPRKKHKKKQKKHKFSFSGDETQIENIDTIVQNEYIYPDKNRRHSNKKEKRKEKRDSIDTQDGKDDKIKAKKDKMFVGSFDEASSNVKKEGKMEDIFGPLSDESDKETLSESLNKVEFVSNNFESIFGPSSDNMNAEEMKTKAKEEIKHKKEKRRKEKRYFVRDDDNSLDVDAVGKAIEARLFAETESEMVKESTNTELNEQYNTNLKLNDSDIQQDQHNEKLKKESREKKKKKKRSREERQNRKDHHFCHHDKVQKILLSENSLQVELPTTMNLDNIRLPSDNMSLNLSDRSDDNKSTSESPSLPLLGESTVSQILEFDKHYSNDVRSQNHIIVEDSMDTSNTGNMIIEVDKIPLPPPLESTIRDLSIPLPEDNVPFKSELTKTENPSFEGDRTIKVSESAVRSIPKTDRETDKSTDKTESPSNKIDKKIEEKPRAIISQEETEDAVAALLGESFGGKASTFANCYEDVEPVPARQVETESVAIDNENMPEEDAEEMRQAVQNLNACEMEIKPDTPISDNDMLLIDTDTEEADEPSQDATDKLPVNIISNNLPIPNIEQSKASSITIPKLKTNIVHGSKPEANVVPKIMEVEMKMTSLKQDNQQITSTATPVITSWTISNNKLLEPRTLNVQSSLLQNRESNDQKQTHVSANIVQIRHQNHNIQLANNLRPIITPCRVSTPYQVMNPIIRPQSHMQPPTIRIPEQMLYQKPQGIVISPRMSNDPRLQSPLANQQGEITSPRLANMTILSTSPQNINSVGLASPNTLQQRSPGQVTVVRMQQPPLSPIQTMHLPHVARTMISPNRPNSVLVQTQGSPIHVNRLPVTPVLAPISKQISSNNIVHSGKAIPLVSSSLMHQQKLLTGDGRKMEQRNVCDNETSKIMSSTMCLPQSTNTTVMAQNRLISMQNAIGNINSALHIQQPNKLLISNVSQFEKRENTIHKSEHNQVPLSSSSLIHTTGINNSSASIIQSCTKPVMCTLPQINTVNRNQGQNVIHAINAPRLLTTTPVTNVIHIDANKVPPSVLSMATIRSPTVLTKYEPTKNVSVSTTNVTNVVMTPLLLKASNHNQGSIKLNCKTDSDSKDYISMIQPNNLHRENEQIPQINDHAKYPVVVSSDKLAIASLRPASPVAKCETDFEELLKDNTNEIKVTNNPGKKLEVNVGNNVTIFSQTLERNKMIVDSQISDTKEINIQNFEQAVPSGSEVSDVKQPREMTFNSETDGATVVKDKPKPTDSSNHKISDISVVTDHEKPVGLLDASNSIKLNIFSDQSPSDYNMKSLDENDSWSAKDVNIESVIKKVDSLCNEIIELPEKKDDIAENLAQSTMKTPEKDSYVEVNKSIETQNDNVENNPFDDVAIEKYIPSKRGGRNVRGKKNEKTALERVQTRQISKPTRGGSSSKRGGRGRGKADKKIKLITSNCNNLPGDVYDFHEDSGDEVPTSPNKGETRPRLILTIKSPLSGQTNTIATSTLSISQKDLVKSQEKINKDEKVEDFVSPSPNTRKSRRLQEKDVQRTSIDDVIEDVVKGSAPPAKPAKETNKRRPTRQIGAKAAQQQQSSPDKSLGSDTRKSPRGVKRTGDRTLSNASTDSSDEKHIKKDDAPEAKIPKLAEPVLASKAEPDDASAPGPVHPAALAPTSAAVTPSAPAPAPAVLPPVTTSQPTPIIKPPKKMISEISAKLASVFEAAATGEVRRGGEGVPSGMMPVGATEASDARVQSPALPHRPPDSNRVTPVLVRGGEGELAGGGGAVAGAAGLWRGAGGAGGAWSATPSLPRGAHHPPPSHHKQVAVVAPHQHHPGAASRATITSVPSISPQGQVALSDLVRSPPPAHQQTSPVASGEGMYPHFSQQQFQLFQQHFRATQHEGRATAVSPYPRGLEAEGSETPPLELRRAPTARAPRPAHSPSPADGLIRYAVGLGRPPPPAHGGAGRAAGGGVGGAGSLACGPPGPAHASQVPREADSLQMLLTRYPVMWQGLLALKNDSAAVQMHFVGGNHGVAGDTLPTHTDGSTPPLRIAQRMRLEPAQLDQVHRKMKLANEHCILLALPCGRDHMDVLQQSNKLTCGFITYLQRKQAAGIVNVAPPGHQQAMYTVHIFPSCEFANENLSRIAPDLMHRVADIAHLLIVIATV